MTWNDGYGGVFPECETKKGGSVVSAGLLSSMLVGKGNNTLLMTLFKQSPVSLWKE
jgi:hypothetical protein